MHSLLYQAHAHGRIANHVVLVLYCSTSGQYHHISYYSFHDETLPTFAVSASHQPNLQPMDNEREYLPWMSDLLTYLFNSALYDIEVYADELE
jgi:hypothetical protein